MSTRHYTLSSEKVFHLCNHPADPDAVDLDDCEYAPRCDAAGCITVCCEISCTSHSGCTSGPPDNWEQPCTDFGDPEFSASRKTYAGGRISMKWSAETPLAELSDIPGFEDFCAYLAESTSENSDDKIDSYTLVSNP